MMQLIEPIPRNKCIEKKQLRRRVQRGVVVELQAPSLRKEDNSRIRIRSRNTLQRLRISQSVRLVEKLIGLSCVGGLHELVSSVVL